jgi:hypothetical protein
MRRLKSFTRNYHHGGYIMMIRMAGHAACIQETRNTYKILAGRSKVETAVWRLRVGLITLRYEI